MSKAFAILIGICFVVLGLATILFALGRLSAYGLTVGPLLFVAGVACFFYSEPKAQANQMKRHNQSVEPMTRSAVMLLFQSDTVGALLVMAHPYR